MRACSETIEIVEVSENTPESCSSGVVIFDTLDTLLSSSFVALSPGDFSVAFLHAFFGGCNRPVLLGDSWRSTDACIDFPIFVGFCVSRCLETRRLTFNGGFDAMASSPYVVIFHCARTETTSYVLPEI
jgi:hypothetical protein